MGRMQNVVKTVKYFSITWLFLLLKSEIVAKVKHTLSCQNMSLQYDVGKDYSKARMS